MQTSPQIAETIGSGQQAVTNTAAKLNSGKLKFFGQGFVLKNLSISSASIFIGGSTVTTLTGYELAAGDSIVLPIGDISTLYVIAAANGTSTAAWIGLS